MTRHEEILLAANPSNGCTSQEDVKIFVIAANWADAHPISISDISKALCREIIMRDHILDTVIKGYELIKDIELNGPKVTSRTIAIETLKAIDEMKRISLIGVPLPGTKA